MDIKYPQNAIWTLGIGYDSFDNESIKRNNFNPKLGVQWNITDSVRLRAAALRTFKREPIVEQTLEPTQIAGFSQFYDDISGSSAKLYGVGIDFRLNNGLYAGAEAIRRDITSYIISSYHAPAREQDNALIIGRNDFINSSAREEELVNGYVYWTPSVNWAVGAEIRFEGITPNYPSIQEVDTMSVPVGVRYFHHGGSFAALTTTFVHQEVEFTRRSGLREQTEAFFVLDAGVGYQFPNRSGLISLEVRNLLNKEFNYEDLTFLSEHPDQPNLSLANKRFVPKRTFIGRLAISF